MPELASVRRFGPTWAKVATEQQMIEALAKAPKTAGPLKVWVDGEVRTPGVFDMAGDIDAWQAVIQAGGFLPTARQGEVALIRRGPGGVRMMRAIDLRPRRGEVIALRRGDIIFVPRSNLGEVANFVTLFRNALPVGFTYAIGGQYQSF
jgi:polysaccharide export outer membrane protein